MVKCGFFNAVKNHDGSYDRGYNSEDINKYFEGAMSENGIYKFVGNQCVVNAYNGMNVLVKDGKGAIKFHWFKLDTDEAVAITPSHPTLSRYTAIVARYDNSNRQIYLGTIDGEYEEIPSKPELIRSDSIYDLCLAYVYVEAGSTEITSENIQDTRGNEELCGFIKTLLDNGSGGGIPQVDHLPLPQASEIGKLYYLTVKDGDNEPGFYTCKRLTIYGYKDINMLSGVIADRPDPQFEFANQVYYATDELKYYVCKKNDEGIYEWNEIEVTETSGLPTASVDTLNNYYLDTTDNTLHLGISEIGYGYAPFNGGGGNFAIIQISCPPGTNVRVSHNGEHQTKEVSDGIWLYGCIDAGEYVVAIPNTSTSQTVTITDKGQVESVYVSEQVVNYDLLYSFGEVNDDLTGGIVRADVSGSGVYGYLVGCKTNYKIDFSNYKKLFVFGKGSMHLYPTGGSYTPEGLCSACNAVVLSDGLNCGTGYGNVPVYNLPDGVAVYDWTGHSGSMYGQWYYNTCNILYDITNIEKSYFRVFAGAKSNNSVSSQYIENTDNIYMYSEHNYGGGGGHPTATFNLYCALLIKEFDDISFLSDYGETIEEIINNINEVLKERDLVTKIVTTCTGDFMVKCLTSTYFKTCYNNSINKDIFISNEIWVKFLPLLNLI